MCFTDVIRLFVDGIQQQENRMCLSPKLFWGAAAICVSVVTFACDSPQLPLDPTSSRARNPVFGLHGGGGTAGLESNGLLVNGASCMGDDALASGDIGGMKSPED